MISIKTTHHSRVSLVVKQTHVCDWLTTHETFTDEFYFYPYRSLRTSTHSRARRTLIHLADMKKFLFSKMFTIFFCFSLISLRCIPSYHSGYCFVYAIALLFFRCVLVLSFEYFLLDWSLVRVRHIKCGTHMQFLCFLFGFYCCLRLLWADQLKMCARKRNKFESRPFKCAYSSTFMRFLLTCCAVVWAIEMKLVYGYLFT